jgi:hypothetical protein
MGWRVCESEGAGKGDHQLLTAGKSDCIMIE